MNSSPSKAYNQEGENINLSSLQPTTDSKITDDTLIHFYNGSPIFLDFLYMNYDSKQAEITSFFEKMKNTLKLRKWKSLRDKDKIYYLYNKIEYFNVLIRQKEESKDKFESLIVSKNKEIQNLQDMIYKKEQQFEKAEENFPSKSESKFYFLL